MSNVKTSKKAMSNVVNKKNLRDVQIDTLERLYKALVKSAGPYGSTTQILKGAPNSNAPVNTLYTKDGHTIINNIKFDMAIEDSLQREISDITRYIKTHVGDGSTSVTILAYLIFGFMMEEIDEDRYPSYIIIEEFANIVNDLKDIIKGHSRDLTLEDVHKICMICTNSNKRVSDIITQIYKEYGLDVFIDVGASTTDHDVIKSYDGLTLEVGYSDPVYINTKSKESDKEDSAGYCIINKPRIYSFTDPIDTMEMHGFFNKIIYDNIMDPYQKYINTGNKNELKKVVPTVIMAPKISLDLNTSFDNIVQFMYQFNQNMDAKPPLLIISNISKVDFEMYSDIWNLCGCRPIKKYIDPEIQKVEQENGNAPTMDNITSFYGSADRVKADAFKTSFINPDNMFAKYEEDDGEHLAGEFKLDENNERILSEAYNTQIAFLEQELKVAIDDNQDMNIVGGLKRRINSLKANMVDYYVGGVTTTDRDATRVLVEDAVKNVRSAAKYGVGYGTNFEGLRAITEYNDKYGNELKSSTDIKPIIVRIVLKAYYEMSRILYSTVYYTDKELGGKSKYDYISDIKDGLINKSIKEGCPMNFKTKEFDHSVLCTIEQDITILDVLSKIITIIYTTNQCLVQGPQYNMYVDTDEMY